MYGEARILKQERALYEAFPRQCKIHQMVKVIARPNFTNFDIPHGISCKNSFQQTRILKSNNEMAIALVKFSLSPESDSIINTIIITLFEINKFNDIQAF